MQRSVINKVCCNVLSCFLAIVDCFFPDWACQLFPSPDSQLRTLPRCLRRGKSTPCVPVLVPYCTWCCRIRTFVLNLKDKEQFSLPSVRTHFSNLLNGCVRVIYGPNTSVNWRSRRKDDPHWGKENMNHSWLSSIGEQRESQCSV